MPAPATEFRVHTVGSIPEPAKPSMEELSKEDHKALYERLMGPTSQSSQLSRNPSVNAQTNLTECQPNTSLAAGDQSWPVHSSAPTEVGGFPLPSLFREKIIGTRSAAPSVQPGFLDRFGSVLSAIEAWPNRLALLNPCDSWFVEDCASALVDASIWNDKETSQGAIVTHLVNAYGAELYEAVSQNPKFAHVTLLPDLEWHVLALRHHHDTRSNLPGSKIEDVMQETEQMCISVVRSELGAAMTEESL